MHKAVISKCTRLKSIVISTGTLVLKAQIHCNLYMHKTKIYFNLYMHKAQIHCNLYKHKAQIYCNFYMHKAQIHCKLYKSCTEHKYLVISTWSDKKQSTAICIFKVILITKCTRHKSIVSLQVHTIDKIQIYIVICV